MTMNHQDTCSFCGKHRDSVKKLIVGDTVAICNECVDLCQTLLVDPEVESVSVDQSARLDPQEIKRHLDEYVIGQDRAKQVLSVAVVNHYKRINNPGAQEIEKANILMLGPTGSGKTLLAKTVARYLDVPFVIADATSLTEAGYVGDDVESLISRLFAAADYNVERCQRGIVFVDEIDKIARKSESTSITRDVSGEGVQQALLKLVEGTKCRIVPQGGRKHPSGDTVEIDTSNILFIAGGAFVGLDSIVKSRVQGTTIGFGSEIQKKNTELILDKTTPDDLVKFGLIPEFIGRFPSWVSLNELSKEDLILILQDVKHSYISQYHWLFEQDQIELDFTAGSIELIAERTIANRTGARGLHSELERILMPHMFYLAEYRKQGIKQVTIDVEQTIEPKQLTVNG